VTLIVAYILFHCNELLNQKAIPWNIPFHNLKCVEMVSDQTGPLLTVEIYFVINESFYILYSEIT